MHKAFLDLKRQPNLSANHLTLTVIDAGVLDDEVAELQRQNKRRKEERPYSNREKVTNWSFISLFAIGLIAMAYTLIPGSFKWLACALVVVVFVAFAIALASEIRDKAKGTSDDI